MALDSPVFTRRRQPQCSPPQSAVRPLALAVMTSLLPAVAGAAILKRYVKRKVERALDCEQTRDRNAAANGRDRVAEKAPPGRLQATF